MTEISIINPIMINDIQEVMGDEAGEVISDLIYSFLQDVPKQIDKMKDGAMVNDRELLMRAAHTLKGSSANLGAEFLSSISYELEASAEDDELPAILSKIDNIESAFRTTQVVLQEIASGY